MLWFKKQLETAAHGGSPTEVIVPAEPSLPFDADLFARHFRELNQIAELDAGIEAYLESLRAKQRLFAQTLAQPALDALTLDKIEMLLETVFSARRRLYPALAELGEAGTVAAVRALLYGPGPLAERMAAFVAAMPVAEAEDREAKKAAHKLRRAAHDFGAELLHFMSPEQYPLMTRWVWDQSTVSGALREFIRGNDAMVDIPLGTSPEMFEGVRQWMADRIAEQGIYRDVPLWIDLMLAQGYGHYFRSMAEGLLSADFGRSGGPEEHIKKFLGIDPVRRGGSRVKKVLERQ